MDTTIHANDVAIVLRPKYTKGEEWDGDFEIIIAGFGPVTMPKDAMYELIHMAKMVATIVPMMEQDEKLTERVITECAKHYGNPNNVTVLDVDDDVADESYMLSFGTKCAGGMQ